MVHVLLSAKNMGVAVPDSLLTWRKQGMDVWAVNAALSAKHFPTDFFLPCTKRRAAAVFRQKGGLKTVCIRRKGSRAAAAHPCPQGSQLVFSVALWLMHSYKRTTQSPSPLPQAVWYSKTAHFLGHLSYEMLLYQSRGSLSGGDPFPTWLSLAAAPLATCCWCF